MTFGALASNYSPAAFIGAIGLAIGIGIQNIPEGAALAIPIRTDGASRWKAFTGDQCQQLSSRLQQSSGLLRSPL